MARDFIMDFETLGQSDAAILLSVGCLAILQDDEQRLTKNRFEKVCDFGIHLKINRKEQLQKNRLIEKETVEWWEMQGDEAKGILSNTNCYSYADVYRQIREFFTNFGYEPKKSLVWSRGLIDRGWWQSYCRTFGLKDFIPYYQWRDTRTALEILCGSSNGPDSFKIPSGAVKHNALHDCVFDYMRFMEIK